MRSAFSGASVLATCTARRAVSAAVAGSSSAWDAKPHVPSTITRTARPISRLTTAALQLAVAQLYVFRRDGVNAQVGVAGSGGHGRRQGRVGQLMARQPEEVGIDSALRCHATTVVAAPSAGFNDSVAARRVRSAALGYGLLAPSLFGVVTFMLLPMLVVLWLSLHRWDLLGPIEFVGLRNWQSVLTDRSFATSLVVTLLFIAIVVPAQTVLGLAAATMLARGLPAQRILSHAVRAAVDLRAAGDRGAVALDPRAHRRRGQHCCSADRIEWLTDPGLALPVVSAVVVWTNVGYVTLFFLAGILNIPQDIHNAARTDGASAWQRFRRITLPMLRPTLFFVLVTGVISAAQVFDTVYALTAGGPQGRTDLVAHRIYTEAFGAAAVGRAAVMAVVLFVLLVGVTIVQHVYFRRRISYDLT